MKQDLNIGSLYLVTGGGTSQVILPYQLKDDIWHCNILMSSYDFNIEGPKFYYYEDSMFNVSPLIKYEGSLK
jgi:hypothetical protein